MPKAKFSRKFDYSAKSGSMVAYPSGYEGDIPQAHYDAAAEAGALDGVTKPAAPQPEGKDGGGKQS